jgi:hypothetical protein
MHPTELDYSFLSSYAAHCEQHCTPLSFSPFYWATLHPTELYLTLLSYTISCWARLHPAELPPTPYRAMLQPSILWCISWSMQHLTERLGTLLSCAIPYWAMQQPNWATYSTFLQFIEMPECRTARYRNKGIPVRYRNAAVPDWDARCQNIEAGGINLDANAQLC